MCLRISSIMALWIALTNYKTKDNIKVIRNLEKKGVLLKGTTEKFMNETEGFIGNVLTLLMKVGLPLVT